MRCTHVEDSDRRRHLIITSRADEMRRRSGQTQPNNIHISSQSGRCTIVISFRSGSSKPPGPLGSLIPVCIHYHPYQLMSNLQRLGR